MGHMLDAVFVTVFLAIIFIGKSSALHMNINPPIYTDDSSGPVVMFCFPDSSDVGDSHISLMEIRKNGGKPLVSLNATSAVSYGTDALVSSEIQAEGSIDTDVSKTYLKLTLPNPSIDDEGVYTCNVHLMDKDGTIDEHSASHNFTVEKFDVKRVVKSLLDKIEKLESKVKEQATKATVSEENSRKEVAMLEEKCSHQSKALDLQIAQLEEKLMNQDSAIQKKFEKVEATAKNQSMEISDLDKNDTAIYDRLEVVDYINKIQTKSISDLDEKGNEMEAFTVALNKDTEYDEGDVIVYPYILKRQGNGYDSKTGVFTAPRAGLYGFHLTVTSRCNECYKDVCLRINGRSRNCARVTSEANFYGQGSISTSTALKKGDKVDVQLVTQASYKDGKKVKTETKQQLGGWASYNQFNGYLIRAL